MATKVSRPAASKDYLELVKKFPLESIRNEAHMAKAQAVMDRLLRQRLSPGASRYLDALSDLVAAYEKVHEPAPDVAVADVLRELMRANKLTQKDLEKKVKIAQSTISAVLNGERNLTLPQIQALARHFHLSPAIFMS
jgi:HTH-type transcriptional regulator/antitoxin HigA